MSTQTLTSCTLLALLLTGPACDRKKAEPPATPAAAANAERLGLEGVRGIRWEQVPEPRSQGAWLPGEAIGDESAQALLASPVKGVVARLLVPPGRRLVEGTPLAIVQSPELARLKADWLMAKARRERLEMDLAREQRLFEAQAGSRRELESAKSEAEVARADQEAARLALEARGLTPDTAGSTLTVKAPRVGTLSAWKVVQGQGVEAGQELGAFQGALAAAVRLELPQGTGETWTTGQRTQVRLGGQHWTAIVEGAPQVLTETHRLIHRLRLEGGALPVPGTLVEVQVPMPRVMLLPQGALQQVEGAWGVFVKKGEEAVFRPVVRGMELGQTVAVLDGLKPGEQVATEGAYLLKGLQMKRQGGGE
jgi:membrane fusion protein, heavy metal efflux system